MSVLLDLSAFRKAQYGLKVDRAAATLPQTAQGALFTVTGGRVILTSIIGEVTVALGATATNANLIAKPTVGTAQPLCAVLAVASKEVGTLFGITGLFTDAMLGANAGASVIPRNPVVVPVGTIDLLTSASDTGSVKWSITYVPFDDGASVVAA